MTLTGCHGPVLLWTVITLNNDCHRLSWSSAAVDTVMTLNDDSHRLSWSNAAVDTVITLNNDSHRLSWSSAAVDTVLHWIMTDSDDSQF